MADSPCLKQKQSIENDIGREDVLQRKKPKKKQVQDDDDTETSSDAHASSQGSTAETGPTSCHGSGVGVVTEDTDDVTAQLAPSVTQTKSKDRVGKQPQQPQKAASKVKKAAAQVAQNVNPDGGVPGNVTTASNDIAGKAPSTKKGKKEKANSSKTKVTANHSPKPTISAALKAVGFHLWSASTWKAKRGKEALQRELQNRGLHYSGDCEEMSKRLEQSDKDVAALGIVPTWWSPARGQVIAQSSNPEKSTTIAHAQTTANTATALPTVRPSNSAQVQSTSHAPTTLTTAPRTSHDHTHDVEAVDEEVNGTKGIAETVQYTPRKESVEGSIPLKGTDAHPTEADGQEDGEENASAPNTQSTSITRPTWHPRTFNTYKGKYKKEVLKARYEFHGHPELHHDSKGVIQMAQELTWLDYERCISEGRVCKKPEVPRPQTLDPDHKEREDEEDSNDDDAVSETERSKWVLPKPGRFEDTGKYADIRGDKNRMAWLEEKMKLFKTAHGGLDPRELVKKRRERKMRVRQEIAGKQEVAPSSTTQYEGRGRITGWVNSLPSSHNVNDSNGCAPSQEFNWLNALDAEGDAEMSDVDADEDTKMSDVDRDPLLNGDTGNEDSGALDEGGVVRGYESASEESEEL